MSLIDPGHEGAGLAFRVAGFPIQMRWTFLVFAALFGSALETFSLIAAWVILLCVSILVHELGHAVAFRRWGVSSRIVLHPMGGVTIPTAGRLPSRGSSIVVSLAGPFSGMVLLGVPAILLLQGRATSDPWYDVLLLAVWINVFWSFVNLLPILPLDGGNVARVLLNGATDGRGEVPARWLSIVVALAVGAFAISQDYVFGGLYALFFVVDNGRALRLGRDRAAASDLRPAAEALEAGDAARATELASGVLAKARDPQLRATATELAAWAALATGDRARALTLLGELPAGFEPNGHLRAFAQETAPAEQVNATVDAWLNLDFAPARTYLARLQAAGLVDEVIDRLVASRADRAESARMSFQHTLFVGGLFDASARLGDAMLAQGTNEPVVAFNVACAHARAGRRDAAFRALDLAVGLGFHDQGMLEADEDLASLRTDPRFAMVRNRLEG